MPRVVKKADGVAASTMDLSDMSLDGEIHRPVVGISENRHLKADLLERYFQYRHIAVRVLEWTNFLAVALVANKSQSQIRWRAGRCG
jgi:hypothetical protein